MFQESMWIVDNHLPSLSPNPWSRLEDKLFERALVIFPDETPNRWQKVAGQVPGKTATEVREHYEALVHDVSEIDSGRVELPSYGGKSSASDWDSECRMSQISCGSPKPKQTETERKKGVPWTEEEHRLFLIGLQKYGKGDWRSISRNAVVSRTPTQVASHAQKYYLRLNSVKKEKKRSSIHDITTVDNGPAGRSNDRSWATLSGTPIQQVMETIGPPRLFSDQFGSSGYQHFGFPM